MPGKNTKQQSATLHELCRATRAASGGGRWPGAFPSPTAGAARLTGCCSVEQFSLTTAPARQPQQTVAKLVAPGSSSRNFTLPVLLPSADAGAAGGKIPAAVPSRFCVTHSRTLPNPWCRGCSCRIGKPLCTIHLPLPFFAVDGGDSFLSPARTSAAERRKNLELFSQMQ